MSIPSAAVIRLGGGAFGLFGVKGTFNRRCSPDERADGRGRRCTCSGRQRKLPGHYVDRDTASTVERCRREGAPDVTHYRGWRVLPAPEG